MSDEKHSQTGSPNYGEHWKWTTDFSCFSKDVPALTWASVAMVCGHSLAWLTPKIKDFYAYTAHYGLHKYVRAEFDGQCFRLMMQENAIWIADTGNDKENLWSADSKQSVTSDCVNRLYSATNAIEFQKIIESEFPQKFGHQFLLCVLFAFNKSLKCATKVA